MDDATPKDPFKEDFTRDKGAEEEAARRMYATGSGGGDDPDPGGGHDPGALEKAAERMRAGAKPKKK